MLLCCSKLNSLFWKSLFGKEGISVYFVNKAPPSSWMRSIFLVVMLGDWKAKKSFPTFELFVTLVATKSDFLLCFNDFVNSEDVLCINKLTCCLTKELSNKWKHMTLWISKFCLNFPVSNLKLFMISLIIYRKSYQAENKIEIQKAHVNPSSKIWNSKEYFIKKY